MRDPHSHSALTAALSQCCWSVLPGLRNGTLTVHFDILQFDTLTVSNCNNRPRPWQWSGWCGSWELHEWSSIGIAHSHSEQLIAKCVYLIVLVNKAYQPMSVTQRSLKCQWSKTPIGWVSQHPVWYNTYSGILTVGLPTVVLEDGEGPALSQCSDSSTLTVLLVSPAWPQEWHSHSAFWYSAVWHSHSVKLQW